MKTKTMTIQTSDGGYRYLDVKPITKYQEPLKICRNKGGIWEEEQTGFFKVGKEWEHMNDYFPCNMLFDRFLFIGGRFCYRADNGQGDTWYFVEKKGEKIRVWEGHIQGA